MAHQIVVTYTTKTGRKMVRDNFDSRDEAVKLAVKIAAKNEGRGAKVWLTPDSPRPTYTAA